MENIPGVFEHESSAKRIKLDIRQSNIGELCNGGDYSSYSTTPVVPIDISEGLLLTDSDSGYEASTLESMPSSSHQTSPHTDPGDIQDSLSSLSEIFFTSSTTDHPETSQDSMDPDDDNASMVSEISGLSDLSGHDWKPMLGSMIWIQKQMQNGVNPRMLLSELGVDLEQVPQYVEEVTLWKLIINMLAEPPRRHKLRHVNTLDDVVRLVRGAQHIIVLTGAGVSVSCGIPDFRSRDGIYERLAKDFPDLPDPQAMFDIGYFNQDPRPFYKFAKDIYPGKFQPSPCHRFIKLLEKYNKLLRNYTQNIDTLEKEAHIEKVIECHGSFATATCTKCGHKVGADVIRNMVLAQQIPLCEKCHPGIQHVPLETNPDDHETDFKQLVSSGIMKPDIVFFGEGLPDTFHEAMTKDITQCDLLLVIGSSLKVRPVALIPSSLPAHVPQILINRESLPHCHFDVELLGDCDIIINQLCHLFGGVWREGIFDETKLTEVPHLNPLDESTVDCCNKNIEDSSISGDFFKTKTEPNCVDDKLVENSKNSLCHFSASTKCSSLNLEKDENEICVCNMLRNNPTSIINKQSISNCECIQSCDVKSVKERHMSVDSARDSGIGENSNCADLEVNGNFDSFDCNNGSSSVDQEALTESHKSYLTCTDSSNLKAYWQPKIRKSLADRLPPHSFHLIKPNRYVFPGAEIYCDPYKNFAPNDTVLESSSSENESDYELNEIKSNQS